MISRSAAKAQGLQRYFSGKPCQNGNVAERLVSSYECLCDACHAEKRAKQKQWYDENATAQISRYREYRENNLERSRQATRNWRMNNPDAVKDYKKRQAAANPHLNRLKVASRRAARQQRIPKWFGEFDRFMIEEAADLASRRESATGIKWHVDHMIPMRAKLASGLHCGDNLQVIPESMNVRKHNKLWLTEPGEWLRHL